MHDRTQIKETVVKLAHDLRNDFTIIRAYAGHIKKKSPPSEIINEKVDLINQTLCKSIERIEIMLDSLKK